MVTRIPEALYGFSQRRPARHEEASETCGILRVDPQHACVPEG